MKGKRIVVTRALHQAEELSTLLRQRGAEPLLYPCIAIAPPEDVASLDASLLAAASGDFDWLILTSANTVPILAQRLHKQGILAQQLAGVKLACVGPTTAEAVTRLLGLRVQTIPEIYVAEMLVTALKAHLPARILLLQADIARPILLQELTKLGATVHTVPAYRTVQASGGVDLPELLTKRQVDAITFTSASTVQNCIKRVEDVGGDKKNFTNICLACIGPLTVRAVQAIGLPVSVEATEHTLEGLVSSLERYFQQKEAACVH